MPRSISKTIFITLDFVPSSSLSNFFLKLNNIFVLDFSFEWKHRSFFFFAFYFVFSILQFMVKYSSDEQEIFLLQSIFSILIIYLPWFFLVLCLKFG